MFRYLLRNYAWTLMCVLAIGIAGYAFMNVALPSARPPFVANIFEISPTAAYLHLGYGFIAMLTGPFQLNASLRNKFLSLHRQIGTLYVISVVLSAISGFYLALYSYGGLVSHVGFGMMACVWLIATVTAYRFILKRNVQEHRKWMIRSYALTLAGLTLRIYLGLSFAAGIKFSEFYPVLAWICWVPNILFVEWYFLYKYKAVN